MCWICDSKNDKWASILNEKFVGEEKDKRGRKRGKRRIDEEML